MVLDYIIHPACIFPAFCVFVRPALSTHIDHFSLTKQKCSIPSPAASGWLLHHFLPWSFVYLLFSISPLISSSPPPCPSLQGPRDSCKTLYQGADLRCTAPSSPPLYLVPPSTNLLFNTLLKCNPHPLLSSTGPLCHHNRAICSWCRGADNGLFYLSLSSTKGPGHWSNASRLMAAQQAAFYACDSA